MRVAFIATIRKRTGQVVIPMGFFMANNLTLLSRRIIIFAPLFVVICLLGGRGCTVWKDRLSWKAYTIMFYIFVGLFPVLRMNKFWSRSDVV